MELKETYTRIQGKYNLPPFDVLNNLFNISSLETTELSLLPDLLKHIADHIDYYEKIIYPLIDPEPSLISMHENKAFSEEEHKEVVIIYKQLMYIQRNGSVMLLKNNPSEQALFIIDITSEWNKMREKIAPILEKIRDSWLQDEHLEQDLGYLG